MIDLSSLEKEQSNVKLWNIIYILCNIVPIIFFVFFVYNIASMASGNIEQDMESIDKFANNVCICIAGMAVPLFLLQFVEYQCKIAKIQFNNAYSNTIVKKVLENNVDISVNTDENNMANHNKIAHLGFAKVGNNISTGSYFSGLYNKLSFEGAYIHTFWRKRHANLVMKIAGAPEVGRIKRRYYKGFFSGVMAEINNINYGHDPIVIYDKKYKKKNFMYEFDENSKITTGNKEFDSKYIVKSANPAKALDYLTEERIQAILETGKINKPHGFHLRGKSLAVAVQSKDLKFSFSVFKKIKYEEEAEKLKSAFEIYYKLLEVL